MTRLLNSGNTTEISPTLAAQMIVGMYPKITAGDPEMFLAGLIALLSQYPPEAVSAIANPANGIATKHKFLPSLAEIRAELDQHLDHYERQNRFASWGKSAALPPPEETIEQREANANRLRSLSARLAESLAAERVPFERKPLPTDAEMVPSDELVAIVKAKYPGPLPEAAE
jgi:hypothetical protein